MRAYLAFTKKELLENVRNYKFFSVLTIFLIFGFLSPLTAYFMPELLATLSPDLAIALPAPTAMDSWMQFYKNIASLGVSLLLIIYCSTLSSEYSKGTLVIMLTKGLPRSTVIWSKFSVTALIMSISFWASFFITYAYTVYFWPDAVFSHVFFAAFALWLSTIMYLSILMLGCVLIKQAFGSIILVLGITSLIAVLSISKQIGQWSPTFLNNQNVDLLSGVTSISAFVVPILVTLCITIGCLVAAVVLFNRKKL